MTDAHPRLLIIDDEPDFASYVREVSTEAGFDTVVADNGAAAVRVLDRFHPRGTVPDIVMPDMDGIEFIGWLAKSRPGSRVLIISGYSPHYADVAQKIGSARSVEILASLNKPIRYTALMKEIERFK